MPVDDFLLPGAFAALFKQLDGICLRVLTRIPLFKSVALATDVFSLFRHDIRVPTPGNVKAFFPPHPLPGGRYGVSGLRPDCLS
jgi:hypothetical protein